MATRIQRTRPLTITELQRRWMIQHGTGDQAIGPQELVTTSDQQRLFRYDTHLAPVDHGSVATVSALSTLYLLPSCTRGVWPGDTCWVASQGCEYRCISGNNATAVWRAVGAGQGAAGSATWGGIVGDIEAQEDLAAVFADKAAATHTHTLADIEGLSEVDGALAYNGTVIGAGGGDQSLADAMLVDDPIALWRMADASGALVDEIAGRNLTVGGSGTLTRQYSPLADSAPVARWYGNLYATHASTLGIAAPWTGSWAFEAAVMLLESPASLMVLFQVGALGDESEAGNSSVFAYVDSSRVLRMIWEYGVGNNVTYDATDYPLDLRRAYLVAARKDSVAKTFEWCIDGRLVSRSSYSQEPTGGSSSYTSVGASTMSGSVSASLLGPIAVYDQALSLTQLRAHARAARLG